MGGAPIGAPPMNGAGPHPGGPPTGPPGAHPPPGQAQGLSRYPQPGQAQGFQNGAPPSGGPPPPMGAPPGQMPYGQTPPGQMPYGQTPYGGRPGYAPSPPGAPAGAPPPRGSRRRLGAAHRPGADSAPAARRARVGCAARHARRSRRRDAPPAREHDVLRAGPGELQPAVHAEHSEHDPALRGLAEPERHAFDAARAAPGAAAPGGGAHPGGGARRRRRSGAVRPVQGVHEPVQPVAGPRPVLVRVLRAHHGGAARIHVPSGRGRAQDGPGGAAGAAQRVGGVRCAR